MPSGTAGSAWWTPEPFEHPELTNQPLTVENSAIARWNALAIRDNLFVGAEDFDEQAGELSHFVAAGGSCIVDLTCEGIGPYPDLLRRMSEAIGLHIVAGAGFYVHASHPPWLESASVSEVAAAIYNQVTSGIGNTAVLPGIIGEIGTSVDFPPCERTVVKAAARVAAGTGTAMNVHTTAPSRHAETIIDLCVTEGLAPERLVFSHLDEVPDPSYHCRVLSSGASIGFDSFGTDFRFGDLWKSPGDTEKMELLLTDLELGYEDQLVMGHDVSLKASLNVLADSATTTSSAGSSRRWLGFTTSMTAPWTSFSSTIRGVSWLARREQHFPRLSHRGRDHGR